MALFKGENRNESISMVIGIILLVFGIIILMVGFTFAFGIVSNPSGFLSSQIPDSETTIVKGPRAEFRFTITDFTVDFQDASQEGDTAIVTWDWDFGDGQTSNQRNPQHTYTSDFNGNVRLTVRDSNDKQSSALGNVQVHSGASSSGNSMPDMSDISSSFDFGNALAPFMGVAVAIASAIVTFFMLFIIWLVGASITKAGWNLIRPRPETIRVRIKPKDLEVEPVHPTTYATPPASPPSAQPPPPTQQPIQENMPPPPE